jgi:probable toxin-antitoxin system toxin component, PIN family
MKVVLDTNVILNGIKGIKADAKILEEIDRGNILACFSTVNLAEVYFVLLKLLRNKADLIYNTITDSKIDLIEPDLKIAKSAAVNKDKYDFSLGDSFVLATALQTDANYIITNDKDFKKVKEVRVVKPSEYSEK